MTGKIGNLFIGSEEQYFEMNIAFKSFVDIKNIFVSGGN